MHPESKGLPDHEKVRFVHVRLKMGKDLMVDNRSRALSRAGWGPVSTCREAISRNEIKHQACGESKHGTWSDDLYCVVAVHR